MPERTSLDATRRGFLGLAGAAAALTTLSRIPLAAASRGRQEVGRGFFSAEQREILACVVERMVASDATDAPAVRDTGAVDTIDRLCSVLDSESTRPLPVLLRLVEWGPALFELRFARFSNLTDAEQDASLQGWMTSRLGLRRLGFLALRNLAFVGYYAQEESWSAIGYRGPLLADEPLQRPGARSS